MARPREYESNAERQKAYRERQQAEQQASEGEHELVVKLRFGYAASESRSERERSDVAARLLGRDPQAYWEGRH